MALTYTGNPCKRGHDGTRYGSGHCVECKRVARVAWYLANPEKAKANRSAWYLANLDRARAQSTAWGKANPEKCRAMSAAYRLANPEKVRAYDAAWYRANPERCRANRAAWQKQNHAAARAQTARRRAIKLSAPGRGVTAAQWKNCLAESGGLCSYCGERRKLTMDHIEPLALGGAHDIDNIAAACLSCNSSKHVTPLLAWLAGCPRGHPGILTDSGPPRTGR